MDWVLDFYSRQHAALAHEGAEDSAAYCARKMSVINRLIPNTGTTLLELGAGNGMNAIACANLGFSVTALELIPECCERIKEHLSSIGTNRGSLRVIQGDFFRVDLIDRFDLVTYWDGFGTGTDEDQIRLLNRISNWMKPNGRVLIEVYSPLYASKSTGRKVQFKTCARIYDFDAQNARWLDTWTYDDGTSLTQSLRTYLPPDLRLLLRTTDLDIEHIETRDAWDWETESLAKTAPLESAISYVVCLKKATHSSN
ncbi:MAG: class I SAM-dependent methyltransferase [Gemmatimonadetes bacterium]|nr:class I SAM-dependent methyltransferase [Gemmatimonadota bacterium]MYG83951.1 class I SAM-dependent methyltransferase [Gemmatimonadota bacterium]MYJ91139.1 class I SAM-dependent methyltransferase [Gemmatimonadota bacterium]